MGLDHNQVKSVHDHAEYNEKALDLRVFVAIHYYSCGHEPHVDKQREEEKPKYFEFRFRT